MKFFRMIGSLVAALSLAMVIAAPVPAEAKRAAGACGPRGCAAAACGTRGCVAGARTAPVYHPPRRGVVVLSPRRYWPPGGAIAAGAAVGFIAGATAVAIAGTPPKPGYCWYYTSPSKATGFWDICPK